MLVIMIWFIVRLLYELCFVKRCCFIVLINVDDDYDDDYLVDYDFLIVWM